MAADGIIERVNGILMDGFEIEPSLLKDDAKLGEDLGLDSLDAVDLIVAIEKGFGCRINETEARAMRTLHDIYTGVRKCIDANAGSPS